MTKVEPPTPSAHDGRSTMPRGRIIALIVVAVAVVAIIVTVFVVASTRSTPSTNAGNDQNLPAGALPTPDPNSPPPPTPTPTPAPSHSTGKASAKPTVDPRYGAPVADVVPAKEAAKLSGGLTATVVSIDATQAKAIRAGETAGPAIKVTVTLTNSTGKDVSLGQVAVNGYYGSKATPAVALSDGAKPLLGTLAAGATAKGVYLYSVPADQRASAVITMTDSAGTPVTVFK